MTDINLAYSFNGGDFEEDFNQQSNHTQPLQQSNPTQSLQQPNTTQPLQQKQLDMSEIQKEREKERERIMISKPPTQQYSQGNMINRNNITEGFNNYQYQRNFEYSFWDRMVMSKREVLKLFILSIVIILGISIYKIGEHYITEYLNSNDLSSFQEFLVRLSYPIIVFLLLWIIKSL